MTQKESLKAARILTEWTDFGEGNFSNITRMANSKLWLSRSLSIPADCAGIADLGSIRTRFERSVGNYVDDIPAFIASRLVDYEAAWTDDVWLSLNFYQTQSECHFSIPFRPSLSKCMFVNEQVVKQDVFGRLKRRHKKDER